MRIIALVAAKGGVGKTTLAIHLAVAADSIGPVVVVDLDPQASAAGWADSRAAEMPTVVACPAARLAATLSAAKAHGARYAVLDTAPHAEAPALAAARTADLVLIPTRPGVLDLRAIGMSVEIAALAKRRTVIVINAGPARGRGGIEAGEAAHAAYGIEICPTIIVQRAVFGHALVSGRTAMEVEPLGRGADEIRALWRFVRRRIDV